MECQFLDEFDSECLNQGKPELDWMEISCVQEIILNQASVND
jgi:hypothetical protein